LATFTYGPAGQAVTIDDRTLAHLRAVIVAKFRRSESFLFTWMADADAVTQHSVWMHPAISVSFDLDTAAVRPLNPAWLDILTKAANSGPGLTPLPEPSRS